MTDQSIEPSDLPPASPGVATGAPSRKCLAAALALGAVLAVLAVAGWFRLSSLDSLPVLHADEAYFGVQATRMAHGESFRTRTPSGNILNPFLLLMQGPLHWVFEPSPWVIRLPVALSGIAAVGLLFAAARRLDRETAILAAVVLATSPKAITFSRLGCEFGMTPLVGAASAWFALRGRGLGFVGTLLIGQLIHPTNVLLALIFGPVFLLQLRDRYRGDPIGGRRALKRWSIVAGLTVVGVTGTLLKRPWLRQALLDRLGRWSWPDLSRFLDLTAVFPLSGAIPGLDDLTHRRLFWIVFLGVVVSGMAMLARARRWDRMALVVGAIAALFSLFILGGADVLGATDRYGAVLLVPGALAVGCLITALLPGAVRPTRFPVASRLVAAVTGAGLLSAAYFNYLNPASPGEETVWTFRAEAPDPHQRALNLIRDDLASNSQAQPDARPKLIIAQDYFVSTPLNYLVGTREDVHVAELVTIPELGELVLGRDPLQAERPKLAGRFEAGDYAVSGESIFPRLSAFIGEVVQDSFPADRVRRWPISEPLNLTVYRVDPPPVSIPTAGEVARGSRPTDQDHSTR